MVGILVSFWDGLFSGAMLISGRVIFSFYLKSFAKLHFRLDIIQLKYSIYKYNIFISTIDITQIYSLPTFRSPQELPKIHVSNSFNRKRLKPRVSSWQNVVAVTVVPLTMAKVSPGPVKWMCFPNRKTPIGIAIDLYLRRCSLGV